MLLLQSLPFQQKLSYLFHSQNTESWKPLEEICTDRLFLYMLLSHPWKKNVYIEQEIKYSGTLLNSATNGPRVFGCINGVAGLAG